jgi:hypothetical protein
LLINISGETLQQTTTNPQHILVWWNSDIMNNNENMQHILKIFNRTLYKRLKKELIIWYKLFCRIKTCVRR